MIGISRKYYCADVLDTRKYLEENQAKGIITYLNTQARANSIIKINYVEKELLVSFKGKSNDHFKKIVKLNDHFEYDVLDNKVIITKSHNNKFYFEIYSNQPCFKYLDKWYTKALPKLKIKLY